MPKLEISDPQRVGMSPSRLEHVSRWMREYVESGRLPCAMTLIARRGEVAYVGHCGVADTSTHQPIEQDTIFRFYSMTKPVVSVAALMLYEEGRYQLDDPLGRFLPEFDDMQVYVSGTGDNLITEPARRPILIRDVFTHTAGFTYSFLEQTAVDALYREHGVDFTVSEANLAEVVSRLAELPLLAHPGEEWNYSVATDVLGRFVEVVSGQTLDQFLSERVFGPLGMKDTAFNVPLDQVGRFVSMYGPTSEGGMELVEAADRSRFVGDVAMRSGGGGLVSTLQDYFQFAEMLRGGGALGGERLLGRKTVEYMTTNHLPGNVDMAQMGQPRFSESSYEGVGFGLGVSVMLDPAAAGVMGTPGEFAWGGAASTAFWIDPAEELTVIFLTQLLPSSTYPLRRELRVLTYQALE